MTYRNGPRPLAEMIRSALESRDPNSLHHFMSGAEGTGGEGGDSGQNSDTTASTSNEAGQESSSSESSSDDGENEGADTFSRDYVEKLRKENAARRKREEELDNKVKEYERKQMTDKERAEAEATDAKKEAESLKAELAQTRLEGAVLVAASAAKFSDPADAVSFLDPSNITLNDDGTPNKNSLNAEIQRILKSKPYLASGTAGSGDGGGRGSSGDSQEETVKKVAAYEQQIQARGGVKVGR